MTLTYCLLAGVIFYKIQICFPQLVTNCANIKEGKTYSFLSKSTQCAMDIYYGLNNPGTRVITHVVLLPDPFGIQLYHIKKVPGSAKSYYIINVHSSLVLDTSGNTTQQQYPVCNAINQQFSFEQGKGNFCYIYAEKTTNGKMALTNINKNCMDFNSLVLTPPGDSDDQLWSIKEATPPDQWTSAYIECTGSQNTADVIFKRTTFIIIFCPLIIALYWY